VILEDIAVHLQSQYSWEECSVSTERKTHYKPQVVLLMYLATADSIFHLPSDGYVG